MSAVSDLPQEWRDGRLYALVPGPMVVEFEGRHIPFAAAGALLIDSRRPEDWTVTG